MKTTRRVPIVNFRFAVVLAATGLILAVCAGCRETLKLSYEPGVGLAPARSCPVALNMSGDFTNYMYATRSIFDAPMGAPLRKYAIYVAQSTFGNVQILDTGQLPGSDTRVVLVPLVANIDLQTEPPCSGDLGVHWDFNDPKTGQTVFSISAQTEYTHPLYFFPRKPPVADVVNHLMTNLTSVTINRFRASSDVQRICGN